MSLVIAVGVSGSGSNTVPAAKPADGAAVVETFPLRPNPVTQDEMDAGSIELF